MKIDLDVFKILFKGWPAPFLVGVGFVLLGAGAQVVHETYMWERPNVAIQSLLIGLGVALLALAGYLSYVDVHTALEREKNKEKKCPITITPQMLSLKVYNDPNLKSDVEHETPLRIEGTFSGKAPPPGYGVWLFYRWDDAAGITNYWPQHEIHMVGQKDWWVEYRPEKHDVGRERTLQFYLLTYSARVLCENHRRFAPHLNKPMGIQVIPPDMVALTKALNYKVKT